jgi:hypothetical protein
LNFALNSQERFPPRNRTEEKRDTYWRAKFTEESLKTEVSMQLETKRETDGFLHESVPVTSDKNHELGSRKESGKAVELT